MTKNEFNLLEINERAELVWSKGVFIDEGFIYGKFQIKMYAMKNFYVEVWINLKTMTIEKMAALESDNDWSRYINSIKIEQLL